MSATETEAIAPLRSLAERATAAVARQEGVAAVALIGSVARGNARADSDVDLLVVTRTQTRASRLMRRLPPSLRDERLSLLCWSTKRWEDEVKRGALFLHHVRLEGKTLYDPEGMLRIGLFAIGSRPPDVSGEIERQLGRLRLYRDLPRLNGQHLFALAHLYAIGKATAMARCVELGNATFVKEQALDYLAARRPALAIATATIARLRPFYDLAGGRAGDPLPFEPVGAENEVRQAVSAIKQLGSA